MITRLEVQPRRWGLRAPSRVPLVVNSRRKQPFHRSSDPEQAMVVAIPVAPLPPETAALLARLMAVAVIGLIGWAAIIALHIAADLYLRRFRLDIDDNLLARKHNTQVRVLARTIDVLLIMLTLGAAMMTFPAVRQYGVSLFASAGIAGIVAGLAARPVLSNLMAGVQLAMTQPIRLYDAVVVENEYGTIEEITSTYVVVKLWDLRRMIVPSPTSSRSRSRTGHAKTPRSSAMSCCTSTTARRSTSFARNSARS